LSCFHLLHPAAGKFKIGSGRFLSLLDEAVYDADTALIDED
jgi:hypothetical protein